jgi:hypothetical protein
MYLAAKQGDQQGHHRQAMNEVGNVKTQAVAD